jgi:ketosteroid isomerase-like protein
MASPDLPEPIRTYFDASNREDVDALAAPFAADAAVLDEGERHVGLDAIRAWARAAIDRYHARAEPRTVETSDGVTTVAAEVSGDFPGSPATLTYRFRLDGPRIAGLEIGA